MFPKFDFSNYTPKPMNMRNFFAVFVPIIHKDGKDQLLFEVRSRTMRRQPSEICFPGGRMEEGETPTVTAVREMEEELGISPIKIHGETDFLVLRTGTVVYPVLGEISPDHAFHFSENEVEEVFTVPIDILKQQKESYSVLLKPEPQFSKEVLSLKEDYPFMEGRETFSVYRHQGKIIWGITGRITAQILTLL